MLLVNHVVNEGDLVHRPVATEEHDIVRQKRPSDIPANLEGRRCGPTSELGGPTGEHPIHDKQWDDVQGQFKDPSLPIPRGLLRGESWFCGGLDIRAALLSLPQQIAFPLELEPVLETELLPRVNLALLGRTDDGPVGKPKSVNPDKESTGCDHPLPMVVPEHAG